ncbi:MAG: hypothetical protein PF508_20415 [Spirochaeta sp.]|jgi:hypothetical protein|nr:hypothetical protein [Spirochaeta sp.]
MKHRTVLALIVMVSMGGSLAAQEGPRWNATLTAGGSVSGGDGMGGLGAEVMRVVGERLEVGLRAYAQAEVSTDYEDTQGREYHMSSGYGTLVVKPKLQLGTRWEIGFPLESGNGVLQYRYGGEYREEMRWTEEIIDQVNHSVYSAGIEPKFFVGDHGAITLAAGYLATGPLRTDLADDGELNGFWGRLGYAVAF